MDRRFTSALGVIALILIIVAAAFYISDQADEPELEMDIGFVQGGMPSAS